MTLIKSSPTKRSVKRERVKRAREDQKGRKREDGKM
jgi:hypothetical protein